MENDNKNKDEISIKSTLIGNSGVGKTCIIKRYSENKFNPQELTSSGGSYSQKILKINNKTIQLEIWDTAGQEQYRSLGRHFYKNAYIVCLVYDITNKESFNDLKEWYSDLKMYGEEFTVVAIVGNKSDCYENEEVKEDEAKEYAKSINANYFLVSAKTGDNIEYMFDNLVKKYLGPEFMAKINKTIKDRGEVAKIVRDIEGGKQKKKKCC